MDFFILDKLVIAFLKSLVANPVKQFVVLLSVWIALEVLFPSKKNKKVEK